MGKTVTVNLDLSARLLAMSTKTLEQSEELPIPLEDVMGAAVYDSTLSIWNP